MIAFNQRYSFSEILESMKVLADTFSEISVFRIIGTSHDDRPIPMVRIGLGMDTLICTAGIHGRESINPVLLLRMIEEYGTAFRNRERMEGLDVFSILKEYSICFVPVANPDGYEIACYGYQSVRNPLLRRMCRSHHLPFEDWKYNARGVDINRNFPCKSYVPGQLLEYPASERETAALMRLYQLYETAAYIDFHSRGNVIYYYRHALSHTYNQRCRRLAKELCKISGYALGKKEEEYTAGHIGGNSVHFYSELLQKPALTIETVNDNASFPLLPEYQEETYARICILPLLLLQEL